MEFINAVRVYSLAKNILLWEVGRLLVFVYFRSSRQFIIVCETKKSFSWRNFLKIEYKLGTLTSIGYTTEIWKKFFSHTIIKPWNTRWTMKIGQIREISEWEFFCFRQDSKSNYRAPARRSRNQPSGNGDKLLSVLAWLKLIVATHIPQFFDQLHILSLFPPNMVLWW